MSKASQRRLAQQQKREAEVRGSPAKRLRMLLDRGLQYDAPVRFWRECVKHLPADPVTPSTEGLLKVIKMAQPMIDQAAATWHEAFERDDEGPDEVLPGIIVEIQVVGSDQYDVKPFSLFGRVESADQHEELLKLVRKNLDATAEAGLWVFGSVVSGPGETYVMAVHKDGTAAAAVRVNDQWIHSVPTFTACCAAQSTVALMIDEGGEEIHGFLEGYKQLSEAGVSDGAEITRVLRLTADKLQTPYLRAFWRVVMDGLSAGSVIDLMQGAFLNSASKAEDLDKTVRRHSTEVGRLRGQLEKARAREREHLASVTQVEQAPALASRRGEGPAETPAQRLATIF